MTIATAAQAAARYGRSRSTIYRWIARGALKAVKVLVNGRRQWRIFLAATAAAATPNTTPTTAQDTPAERPASLWERWTQLRRGY